ncbi:eukaryotic translation initiation factor 4E transporter-like isoform X2 [Branchiostoma floridae]|uniref:Eukaryotic translation initiation factor 4E transporter-like isoform X2 n=1 Tax=Branchiostoma floridae TaxID=7739 RepID=A0A9J7M0H3_BRAFL|nr:eukaryotic translation initiation factor 4E transporter-like isoform X2 [Branchiostoma floridae]
MEKVEEKEGSDKENEEKEEKEKKDAADPPEAKAEEKKLPKHRYNKEELMNLAKSGPSKQRPAYLSKEFDSPEGIWDPERWHACISGKRSATSSPAPDDHKRSRMGDDREIRRKSFADPRERVREDDKDGIVLSPQRRSFGSGCQVTTQTSNNEKGRGSPMDRLDRRESESGRGNQRRIGSGRLNLFEREREAARDGRDLGRDGRDRDFGRDGRDRDRDLGRDRDRDLGRDRDRDLGRDHRDRDRDLGRDMRDRDFGRDSRDREMDYKERNRDRGGRDRHDPQRRRLNSRPMDEPEWFSAGPTSQSDTIELGGYEDYVERKKRDNKKASSKQPDRNGSLETNSSSSPEMSQDGEGRSGAPATAHSSDFNFDEFFNIDGNIPGFPISQSPEESAAASSSRFSRWFASRSSSRSSSRSNSRPGSRSNSRPSSRRSSIHEELERLTAGMEDKGHSPIAPPPAFMYSQGEQQKVNILEMLSKARIPVHPLMETMSQKHHSLQQHAEAGSVKSVQEIEAELKQLVIQKQQSEQAGPHRAPQHQQAPTQQPMFPRQHPQEHQLPRQPVPTQQPAPPMSGPRQGGPVGGLSAFDKLVATMQATGTLPQQPKALVRSDGRPLSPLQVLQMDNQKAQRGPEPPKDVIQELMKQTGAASLQQAHMSMAHSQRHAAPPRAPSPPLLHRPPSPHDFLMAQGSPRVPSPLGFSPVPSPTPGMIGGLQVPSSMPGQLPGSPMTGQYGMSGSPPGVRPPFARVPSPQELAIHTQRILQEAVIKKQLEKQRDSMRRAHSPSFHPHPPPQHRPPQQMGHPHAGPPHMGAPHREPLQGGQHTPTSTANKPRVPAAFTPTAVIRQLHNKHAEDMDKEEKEAKDHGNRDSPVASLMKELQDKNKEDADGQEQKSGQEADSNQDQRARSPTEMAKIAAAIINKRLASNRSPVNAPHPLFGHPVPQVPVGMVPRVPIHPGMGMVPPGVGLPPNHMSMMRGMVPPQGVPAPHPAVAMGLAPPGMDMRHLSLPPGSHPHPAMLQQQLAMQNGLGQQVAMQQLMQRTMSPQPNRTVSPQAHLHQRPDIITSHTTQNGPGGPLAKSPTPADNLAKWFGQDVLRQPMPAPSLPSGQKVLSLDDLERPQQAAVQ